LNRIPSVARLTLILGALAAFAPLATDMYLASFPALVRHFRTDMTHVQNSVSVFFLGLAAGQLFYGPLIDRFGRRIPLLAGEVLFTVSSLALILVPHIDQFLAVRLLQAIGGCSGMVVGRAVIQDLFAEREAAGVLSGVMMVQAIAPIAAPVLGAYLLEFGGWRSIFMLLTLFGAACCGVTAWGLPETLPSSGRRREGIGPMILVYLGLLGQRSFVVPAVVGGLGISSMFAFIAGSPFVFMTLYGASARQYGLLFALNALASVIFAQGNRYLLRRFPVHLVFSGAIVVNLVAAAALLAVAGVHSLPVFLLPLWFVVATVPVLGANSTAIAMAASSDRAGSASGLIGVMQFGMASIASALVGLFANGTAYPMIGVMLGSMSLGGVIWTVDAARSQTNRSFLLLFCKKEDS